MLVLAFAVLSVSFGCKESKKNEYNIIPFPQELVESTGVFTLNNNTEVLFSESEGAEFVAKAFADFIKPATAHELQVASTSTKTMVKGAIVFIEDKELDGEEGSYKLTVTPNGILAKSNNPVGLYYAFQTIRQLLPVEIESKNTVAGIQWNVPSVEISDAPRFSYRGLHLDVGRHFFPVDFIKKFIDLLALHKMNVFHWHLTEDQGWRLEIKKYPKLAEIAAHRDETRVGHGGSSIAEYDGKPYGGFYTQEQAKEIVKYAADRHITVIPEIELPGHAQAVLTAYPELGCTGGPYEVAKTWGVFEDVFCAGNEQSFQFLEDVLVEVMEIFPSKYIHIGGDECPKTRWNECPKCKKRMRNENCKDAHELQSYFISRIEKFLNGHGRDIIGWDEILEGGLAPNATVMSWRGIQGGIEAAKQKHNVIMTPNSHFYLDHYQNNPDKEPLAIGGFLPLSKVYSYNPYSSELTADEMKYIIGVQGNLWTEYMKTSDHVEYMAYPRACAISEVGWLDYEKRNFGEFALRLQNHFKRLDMLEVNYFNKILMPSALVSKVEFLNKGHLVLENNAVGAQVYYTLDGSTPTKSSTLYTGAIEIDTEGVIKAVAINLEGESSEVLEIESVNLKYMEGTAEPGAKNGLSCKLSVGKFSSCKEVEKAEGKIISIENISIPDNAPHDHFGLQMEGFVTISQEGLYKISLGSDDGSMLYLNDQVIIDNDGYHGMEYQKASVALKVGTYPIKVVYCEATGGENLKVSVVAPGGEAITNISEFFSH